MRLYSDVPLWAGVSAEQWGSWKWQLSHRLRTLDDVAQVVELTPEEREGILRATGDFPLSITPYYASLMNPYDPMCPVRRLAVPTSHELNVAPEEREDPLDEQADAPVPLITHRYPDRVLFLITDMCSMYCRHCTRRHFTGEFGHAAPRPQIDRAISYIRDTPAVRDVLISGGDALLVGDDWLEYVISRLRAIEHVEVIRLGTRMPVVCPQRITPELCAMLRRYHPIYLNTHFNHPREITPEAAAACAMLADAGVPLGNQVVLLRDLNDCPVVMRRLMQECLETRVRPYYIYQCDLSPGLSHFRTPISRGIEIMEMLRGHTTGFAVPTFVVDAPGGGGKIPVMPNYVLAMTPERVVLRNYEGVICSYAEPEAPRRADGPCPLCQTDHSHLGGIGQLLYGGRRALEPEGLERRLRAHGGHSHALEGVVQQVFGVRNDEKPNRIYVSPRLGFSWTYGGATQIAAFEGAARAPRAVVRGGFGVFQDSPGATLIGSAIDNTGLPSAVQQLRCVGTATPIPDWAGYLDDPNSVPSECADGTNGSVFASTAPNVTLFAKDFSTPRSVRSNLQWNGPILTNRFSLTAEAIYSRNLNQRSYIDLNFNPVTQFRLTDEGDRPVFVQPGSIVPTTGAIASADARVSPLFNRVTEQVSDMKSETRQLRFSLRPIKFSQNFTWNLTYVYSNNREQFRGFNSTVGNPLDVQWGRGDYDSRHQINYTLRYNFFDAVRVNWNGRFSSGGSFTPSISGDVNGDGYSNDRAFVFNPATATDPMIAGAMQALLDGGSKAARDCLSTQLGKLAAYGSCQGPWTSSANLSFALNPLKFRLPQRATLSFSVNNPLGAADILLHGENNLHGWGQRAFADPTLLYVRGFDPVHNRYIYDVNSRFGSTNPQFQRFRSPVTITMALRVDVGPSRERQTLTQQLDRGRARTGNQLSGSMLKSIYGNGGVLNPMAQMLRQSDTLELTGPQADSLATMNRRYTIELDSIWSPVAKYWAALPKDYDQDEAYAHYRRAREATVDLLLALAPRINALLTDEQKRRLPELVASHINTRYLRGIRSGTAGSSSGGAFGGGRS